MVFNRWPLFELLIFEMIQIWSTEWFNDGYISLMLRMAKPDNLINLSGACKC